MSWSSTSGSSDVILATESYSADSSGDGDVDVEDGGIEMETGHRYWVIVLLVIPALTVFGNVLVVLSVAKEKSLRSVTNYFIVSLAIADIAVAILVMPLAVYVEVNNGVWGLGDALCDMWVAFDVMGCTASILNLTAISIDRFIAVTRPLQYANHRFSKRVHVTLALTWIVSAAVSSPIVLGWNYTERRRSTPHICTFYNADFLIYSSMASFYIPCIAMILLYCKTLRVILARAAARSRQRRRNNAAATNTIQQHHNDVVPTGSRQLENRGRTEDKQDSCIVNCRQLHHVTTKRHPSDDDVSIDTTTQAEELAFDRGNFRSMLFQSAARRILLRVFPGRSCGQRCTPNQDGNKIKPTMGAFQMTWLNRRGNESPAETTARTDVHLTMTLSARQAAEIDKESLILADTTDGETIPLTRRQTCVTTTDGSEPEVKVLNDDEAVTGNNSRKFYTAVDSCSSVQRYRNTCAVNVTSLTDGVAVATHVSNKGGGGKQNARKTSANVVAREKNCGSRERKATKTLAIVLGVFLLCWVPFFTLNIINAICIRYNLFSESQICNIHPMAFSMFVWLGYINSFLNPVIYTIFNVEFRKAFKKLLQHPCA